jgi:peptidoglycan/LPS O-acetylase OafA/YrhL
LNSIFENIKKSNAFTVLSQVVGLFLMFTMTTFGKMVQGSTSENNDTSQMIYLVTCRPVYIFGFSLFTLPLLLKNDLVVPIQRFLGHWWFVPYSRLTYGMFLSSTILMQFSVYNLEDGTWAQRSDVSNMCFAYMTLSICISLLTYVLVEAPMANIHRDFFKVQSEAKPKAMHYRSQSAKAILRKYPKKSRNSAEDPVEER